MKIQNLQVWLIDTVQHLPSGDLLDTVEFNLNLGNMDNSYLPIIPMANLQAFKLSDILNIAPNFEHIVSALPMLLFVDADRNIGVYKIDGPLTSDKVKAAMKYVTKLKYSNTLGEYVNEQGLPIPRVIFRDPQTGFFQVALSTWGNFRKYAWGGLGSFAAYKATTSKNKTTQAAFGLVSLYSWLKFFNP